MADADTAIRPYRVDIPQAALDDLAGRLSRTQWPDGLPGATGSDGMTTPPVPGPGRVLAGRIRLAGRRAPAELPSPVRHGHRRGDYPLPARPVLPRGRHAAAAHPRLARLGPGVPGPDRAAGRAGRRGRARVPPGHPLTAGVRVLRPDPGPGLGPLPDRAGLGRADAPPRLG